MTGRDYQAGLTAHLSKIRRIIIGTAGARGGLNNVENFECSDDEIGDRLAHDVRDRHRPVRGLPLLPLIAADYRISPSLAGLGVALFALTYMIAAPLLGHLADRIGRRRMLTCCLFGFAFGQSADRLGREFHLAAFGPLACGCCGSRCRPALRSVAWLRLADAPLGWRWSYLGSSYPSSLGAPIGGLMGVLWVAEYFQGTRGLQLAAGIGESADLAGRFTGAAILPQKNTPGR
jgi:MFS family permease